MITADEKFATLWKTRLAEAAEKARSPDWKPGDVPWDMIKAFLFRSALETIAEGMPAEDARQLARRALEAAGKMDVFGQ